MFPREFEVPSGQQIRGQEQGMSGLPDLRDWERQGLVPKALNHLQNLLAAASE